MAFPNGALIDELQAGGCYYKGYIWTVSGTLSDPYILYINKLPKGEALGGGTDWVQVGSYSAGSTFGEEAGFDPVNGNIHLLTGNNTAGYKHHIFDMDTETWSLTDEATTVSHNTGAVDSDLLIHSDGAVIVLARDQNTGDQLYYYKRTAAGAWGARTLLVEQLTGDGLINLNGNFGALTSIDSVHTMSWHGGDGHLWLGSLGADGSKVQENFIGGGEVGEALGVMDGGAYAILIWRDLSTGNWWSKEVLSNGGATDWPPHTSDTQLPAAFATDQQQKLNSFVQDGASKAFFLQRRSGPLYLATKEVGAAWVDVGELETSFPSRFGPFSAAGRLFYVGRDGEVGSYEHGGSVVASASSASSASGNLSGGQGFQFGISPDAIISQTNLTGAVADIQDDPESPDANWLTANSLDNTVLHVSFPTPNGPLEPGADLQTFRVWARKTTSVNTSPLLHAYLYEGGVQKADLGTATVTSDTGQVVEFTWDAASLADVSGADVELRVVADNQDVITQLVNINGASPTNASDDVRFAHNPGATESQFLAMGDMPVDFHRMSDFFILRLEYRASPARVDDTMVGRIRVVAADQTTPLAPGNGSYATYDSSVTNTTDALSLTQSLSGPVPGDKATWDGALIEVRQEYTTNMGGDGGAIEIDHIFVVEGASSSRYYAASTGEFGAVEWDATLASPETHQIDGSGDGAAQASGDLAVIAPPVSLAGSADAASDADATLVIVTIERVAPLSILVLTNLSGSVTDIQDDPDAADANWLVVS